MIPDMLKNNIRTLVNKEPSGISSVVYSVIKQIFWDNVSEVLVSGLLDFNIREYLDMAAGIERLSRGLFTWGVFMAPVANSFRCIADILI